jgi:T-complex protein 1 subunit eta|uniref:T-complex protein 1 subunit eta n=1 Tax=Panagrolaimus sp. PS1159 TaxID=55785 RepID=A0AC35GNP2_9BILA
MSSAQMPIILLRDGTENRQGRGQVMNNINACINVSDYVRTTLGPRGMDKLVVDRKDKTTISNDGATIMNMLDIVYPAAKIMTDIAKNQDNDVGDGTTSVVILAAEFLKQAKQFVEDGVSPQLIIHAYYQASEEAIKRLDELATKIPEHGLRDMLVKCAATTLSSKLVAQDRQYFAELVVDAVNNVDDNLPVSMIGVKKISGGSVTESHLVKGVAFKKAFSYAGFEMQPKHYKNVTIALLNIELELKAEKDNGELRVNNVSDFEEIVNAEWNILYNKLEKIHASGVKIVLSKLPIGDVATQWFADRDMFCAGRIPEADLKRTQMSCGGQILTTVSKIESTALGKCDEFYEKQLGNERFNYFIGGSKAQSCTIILRGGAEQFIAESERALHDAIMVVRRAKKNDTVVAGGGAIEMELSHYIREKAKNITTKEQFFWKAYGKAFEIIPQQLCFNAGIDGVDILNQLRNRHLKGEKHAGVDIFRECVRDNLEGCIWEPVAVKRNAINAATEAACVVLSIDQTITNQPKKNEMPGLPSKLQ